mgnify:FL=1
MSKDNPTQYHTRTIDLFLKSYFSGYASLNEAADVMFSANNLENHGYAVPSFVNDIEKYLISKAKIHSFESGNREEQAHIFSESSKLERLLAKKHSHQARRMFDFDMWADTKPDDKDTAEETEAKLSRRRMLTQRFLGWQMSTRPREGTAYGGESHPAHDLNMFHEGRASSSSSTSMLHQFLTSMFLHTTDDELNYEAADFAMSNMGVHDRLAKPDNMGKWFNGDNGNESSWTRQFTQYLKKYTNEYNKRFPNDPKDSYKNDAIQHKLWELRGVPNSLVWNTMYDIDGLKRGDERAKAAETLKLLSQDPQNRQYKGGFFALYLGIPLLDYEDQLKVCEWFLDGAGNSGDGKQAHHFDDSVINNIMGHNARGFMTRHATGFANSLRAIYAGNPSTTGHNTLVGGTTAYNPSQMAMAANRKLYEKLARIGKTNKEEDTRELLGELPMNGEDFDDILSTISVDDDENTVADIVGNVDVHNLPDFENMLDETTFRKVMKQIAFVHGEKGGSVSNNEFHNNSKFLFKLKDKDHEFDPYGKDPEVKKTMLYYYAHALGSLEGAMGEDWSHWQDLMMEAFPQLFIDNTYFAEDGGGRLEERILPSSKREVEDVPTARGNEPVKFQNQFRADEDDSELTRTAKLQQLKYALASSDMPHPDEYYIDKYEDGAAVKVDYNQTGLEGEGVDQEEYMRQQLGDMSVDDFIKDYENRASGNTIGQSAIISPMLIKPDDYGNPGLGSASADRTTNTNQRAEVHVTAMDAIKAMRHQQLIHEKYAGKRAEHFAQGGSFSRDKRGRETDNEHLHSSEVSQADAKNRALIGSTLLFQNHHGIDTYSKEAHDTHNQKQDDLILGGEGQRDPIGRGPHAGTMYHNELMSGEDIPDHLAVYDREDFNKAIESEVVELPTPLRNNIEDRHQLRFQLSSPKKDGIALHHNEAGVSVSDMGISERNKEKKNMTGTMSQEGFYKNDEGELKSYIVERYPQKYYQDRMHGLRRKMLDLYDAGDIESAESAEVIAQKQALIGGGDRGDEPPISSKELREDYLKDMRDGHRASLAVSQFMRPLVMFANPEYMKTHTPQLNNLAWADTKMFAGLCESFERNLNPKQKRDFIMNGMVHHGEKGGVATSVMDILEEHFRDKGIPEEQIKARILGDEDSLLSDMTRPAWRKKWTGDKNEGNHIEGFGDDGNSSILHMMEKYVNGETDYKEKFVRGEANKAAMVKDIFEAVRETLPKGASIGEFAKALHARYIPHREDGTDLTGEILPQVMREFGETTSKKALYNYQNLNGGHHHDNELDGEPLMSGGDSIMNRNSRQNRDGVQTVSMYHELKSLDRVFRDLYEHTKGTANGIPGNVNNISLLNKKGDDWTDKLPVRMRKFMSLTQQDVESTPPKRNQINSSGSVQTGGLGIDTLRYPHIETCRHTNKKLGHVTRPSQTFRNGDLKQNRLVIDSPKRDFHGGKEELKAFCPYASRDYNPDLKPYDLSADNGTQFPPVQMQASGTPGSNINYNYPAFIGAGSGVDLRLMDDDIFDYLTDDTLVFKADGRPVPVKAMHRIFDYSDLKNLRGFSGDWIASHIIDGEPVILQKKGKRIKAYNADMKLVELTDDMNDEMGKVSDKDFVVHAIIDGENLYFIDLLEAADEKTHNMPAKDRVRHLRAHFESSVHIKMPEPYNTKRADDEGLEQAIHLLREESSSDILLRDASTTYMRGETRHPKWVVLSKEKKVDVIILDRKGMNYRIGVGPIMHPENYGARSVEMEGEHYMDVGSAKGPRGYDKGEHATVFCTGATQSGEENPTYKIRSARIDRDAHPQAADSVETLSMLVNNAKIPHKVRLNKGSIHIIFPRLDDEVIYKVDEQEGGWMLEPQKTLWGQNEDYFIKLSEDMRPHWEPFASLLLKREVKPELPAGHSKKRKEVLPEEEEIIKRGLEMAELMLERVSKEKITSTGVEGLGINYAGADVESPRGPTTNMTDDTNLDFNPSDRDYKEKAATTKKKTTHIRTTEGEEAITDNRGNVTITKPRV